MITIARMTPAMLIACLTSSGTVHLHILNLHVLNALGLWHRMRVKCQQTQTTHHKLHGKQHRNHPAKGAIMQFAHQHANTLSP